MKKIFPVLSAFLILSACGGEEKPVFAFTALRGSLPPSDPASVDPALVAAAAQSRTAFAVALYQTLLADPARAAENLVLSPFSISVAFNLLFPGAAGVTADSIRSVFFLDGTDEEIFAGQGALDRIVLAKSTKKARLESANSAFIDLGFEVYPSYLDVMTYHYGAEIYQADFFYQWETMRQEINRWVAYKTADRIQDLLPPGSITQTTGMVLVNAIYFNARWKTAFEDGTPMEFHGTRGSQTFTSMHAEISARMHDSALTENPPPNRLQILAVPYQDEHFDMLIFLPDDFAAFSAGLDEAFLRARIADVYAAAPVDVAVDMPEFTIGWEMEMSQMLEQEMGLVHTFCDEAVPIEFTRIADADYNPCVSKVFHKAFIEVSKRGTEAAAATAVVVDNNCNGADVHSFIADRPFLYAIVERETRTLLFLGHVMHL